MCFSIFLKETDEFSYDFYESLMAGKLGKPSAYKQGDPYSPEFLRANPKFFEPEAKKYFEKLNFEKYLLILSQYSEFLKGRGKYRFQKGRKEKILEEVKTSTSQKLLENYKQIGCFFKDAQNLKAAVLGTDISFLCSAYENLKTTTIIELAKEHISGNMNYGWPDIVFTRDKEIVFIEVKTRDNLSFFQMVQLNKLKTNGCRIGVLQLD